MQDQERRVAPEVWDTTKRVPPGRGTDAPKLQSALFPAIILTKNANLFTNEVSLSSANDLPQPRNRVVSPDWDAGLRQSDGANRPDFAGC